MRPSPRSNTLAALALAALLLTPIIALIVQGARLATDPSTLGRAVADFSASTSLRLWDYAWGSLAVASGATAVAGFSGVASAFFLARWTLPCHRLLLVLAIVPLGMPSYLATYTWVDSLVDWGIPGGLVRSLPAAWLLLGLALSPYVFLAAFAAFAQTPRNLTESARLLGRTRWGVFWSVEAPLAAPAIITSCLLVTMEVFADFGTVEHLALDTWSTGVYRSWSAYYDPQQAIMLALTLLVAVAALSALMRRTRAAQSSRPSVRALEAVPRQPVGPLAMTLATAAILLPAMVVGLYPLAVLGMRWFAAAARGDFGFDHRGLGLAAPWLDSLKLSTAGAVLVLVVGVSIVVLLQRCRSPVGQAALRLGLMGYALPGTVLALGLLLIMTPLGLGGSMIAVLLAYVVRYVTVVVTPLENAWLRLPQPLFEQARILGATPMQSLKRVGWPLMRPTLSAATILTALDIFKELPATLMLRPFGMDTLAINVYGLASDERLAEAAPAALTLMATCLLGLVLAIRAGAFAGVMTPPRSFP